MAYKAFSHAEEAFGGLIALDLKENSPVYDAVCCGGSIAYVRPFKTKKGENLWKPDDRMIPKNYRKVHDALILFRDKILAHADQTGTESRRGQVNQLEFKVEASVAKLLIVDATFKRERIDEMHALCLLMKRKTAYHLQKEMDRLIKRTSCRDGHYVLSLDPNKDALIPYKE